MPSSDLTAPGDAPRAASGRDGSLSPDASATDVDLPRGDATLRGTASGRGPTLILLHAGGERRRVWDPVREQLDAKGLRTVAYDQRGHGESPGPVDSLETLAADVRAMVEHEAAPVVLVGASLGGFAALAALADPATEHRVAGLVLVDVVPDPPPAEVRAWLDQQGLLRPGRTEVVDDILRRGRQLRSTAAALRVPVLLVRGGQASPLRDADVDRLRAANALVTVAVVAHAGHLVARDAPVDLARIVADHATAWFRTRR